MALDIEHFLKVALIKAIEDRIGIDGEDGYRIVLDYLTDAGNESASQRASNIARRAGSITRKLSQNKNNPYCGGLTKRYADDLPIWAFVELISFGDLKDLIEYYGSHTDWHVPVDLQSLDRVRQIRNACAHGNAIINDLNPYPNNFGKSYAPPYISAFLYGADIKQRMIQRKMSNPRISQIVHLLYVYDQIVKSPHTRDMRLSQLKNLVNNRCVEKGYYFQRNMLLTSTHQFFVKLVSSIN